MDLKRRCMLCGEIKDVRSFDRTSELCNKCYGFLKSAHEKGVIGISISRKRRNAP